MIKKDFQNRNDVLDFMREKERNDELLMVIFLGIIGINKTIEDYGFDTAEEVDTRTNQILSGLVGDIGIVAKYNGGEFIIALTLENKSDRFQWQEKIRTSLSYPNVCCQDIQFHLAFCAGVVLSTQCSDPSWLLQNAFISLQEAKKQGNAFHYAACDCQEEKEDSFSSGEFYAALHLTGQISPVFQPIVTRENGGYRTIGVEALSRWNGFRPDRYLDAVRKNGLLFEHDKTILEIACAKGVKWADEHDVTISVNVPPDSISNNEIVNFLIGLLEKTGLPPEKLLIELLEDPIHLSASFLENLETICNSLGIGLALDDFGEMNNGIGRILELPEIRIVKINGPIIAEIGKKSEAEKTLKHFIALAKDFGFEAVPERVETEEQLKWLESVGYRTFQGYLFSRELTESGLTDYLAQSKTVQL